MSEHTPGPWKITDHNRAGDTYIGRDKGLHIAIIPPASPFVPEQEANAKLIAAAPDLLRAMEDIEANLSGRDCFAERVADSLKRAKAAIAKATD